MEEDKRVPPSFFHDFEDRLNGVRGGWNPRDDPHYDIPKEILKSLNKSEKAKMKKKAKTEKQRKRDKEAFQLARMWEEREERRHWLLIKDALEELWTGFLSPPQGKLLPFFKLFIEADKRFPSTFFSDFVEILNVGRGWNQGNDPQYDVPKKNPEESIQVREREDEEEIQNREAKDKGQASEDVERLRHL